MQAPRPATSSRILTILLLTGLTTALVTAGCLPEDGDEPADAGSGGAASGGETASGGAASGGETASGGAASGGAASGGESGTVDYPTDSSQSGIEAFLEAESYKSAPWVGDPAPRVPSDDISPHGPSLQVYFNTAAAASSESGEDAAINSMVVKETYDPDGLLLGKMVRLKTGAATTSDDWTNYCYVSSGSAYCTGVAGDDNPYYETEGLHSCTFCHSNTGFYSPLPE